MKIKFKCPQCDALFEKEERVLARHIFLDCSSEYSTRCPNCTYSFKITDEEIKKQVKDYIDKLSNGGN